MEKRRRCRLKKKQGDGMEEDLTKLNIGRWKVDALEAR